MSGSSLPPSSSPSSSDSASRRASPHAALAFLVHSPNTVANHLPPDVDNRPLARQKRRRTSKEDEEILKAEYLKNPKPDKAARLQIVTKVALGEKEVQIWFQNKRQNDRRRSRPVDSSSSVPLMSESSTMSDPPSEDGSLSQEKEQAQSQNGKSCCEERETAQASSEQSAPEAASTPTPATDEPSPSGASAESAGTSKTTESPSTVESIAAPLTDSLASADANTVETAITEVSSSQQAISSSQGASQPPGSWISNRRSASFRQTEEYSHQSITFTNPTPPPTEPSSSARVMKRAHSFVRLSMADDGTARVITDADKTPSPPHVKTNPATFSRAAAGLRRSYSAAGLNERLAAVSRGEPSPKMPRTSSTVGRSRDSRAWEFWCDPDTRNSRSLTTRANQEGSGSAADAIGLLRANRRVLSQNQLRQNAPVLSRGDSAKALNGSGIKKPRPPMQRSLTSQGRLQTKRKAVDYNEADDLPQTESDKENWEPEGQKAARPRKQGSSFSQRRREVLGENTEIMSQSSSLGAMMAREKRKASGAAGGENSDPEKDDELRFFMNGGDVSARSNLSTAEEAGCVEGLLKLSQGNWR